MHPLPPEEFLNKLIDAARDAKIAAPADAEEERALYEAHVINNPDWVKKGTVYRPELMSKLQMFCFFLERPNFFVPLITKLAELQGFQAKTAAARLGAWFSIVPAAKSKDHCYTLWRTWLRWLCKALLGQGRWAKQARDAAVKELAKEAAEMPQGDTKQDHKERLRKLKKKFTNSLLLSAVLSNNYNWFQMRLVLTIGEHFYKQQAFFGKEKRTPEEHLEFCVSMSCGNGGKFLRSIWVDVACDVRALARLGLKTTEDSEPQNFGKEWDDILQIEQAGIDESTIADRIMTFLSSVLSQNLFTYLWHQFAYPPAFAQLLAADPDLADAGMRQSKKVWETALHLEGSERPALASLRQKIFWLDFPSVQLRFRVLDHCGFDLQHELCGEVLQWLRRSKCRIGDSAVVENTNKKARRAEATGSSKEINASRIFHSIRQLPNALSMREIPEVKVPDEAWDKEAKLEPTWKARANLDLKMPKMENVPDPGQDIFKISFGW